MKKTTNRVLSALLATVLIAVGGYAAVLHSDVAAPQARLARQQAQLTQVASRISGPRPDVITCTRPAGLRAEHPGAVRRHRRLRQPDLTAGHRQQLLAPSALLQRLIKETEMPPQSSGLIS